MASKTQASPQIETAKTINSAGASRSDYSVLTVQASGSKDNPITHNDDITVQASNSSGGDSPHSHSEQSSNDPWDLSQWDPFGLNNDESTVSSAKSYGSDNSKSNEMPDNIASAYKSISGFFNGAKEDATSFLEAVCDFEYEDVRKACKEDLGFELPAKQDLEKFAQRVGEIPEGFYNPNNREDLKAAIKTIEQAVDYISDVGMPSDINDDLSLPSGLYEFNCGVECSEGRVEFYVGEGFESKEKTNNLYKNLKNLWPFGKSSKVPEPKNQEASDISATWKREANNLNKPKGRPSVESTTSSNDATSNVSKAKSLPKQQPEERGRKTRNPNPDLTGSGIVGTKNKTKTKTKTTEGEPDKPDTVKGFLGALKNATKNQRKALKNAVTSVKNAISVLSPFNPNSEKYSQLKDTKPSKPSRRASNSSEVTKSTQASSFDAQGSSRSVGSDTSSVTTQSFAAQVLVSQGEVELVLPSEDGKPRLFVEAIEGGVEVVL